MKRRIIAIDIDDVIAHSSEAFRLRVNKYTGADLTREHYSVEGDYYGYYERVWEAHGLGDKINFDVFEEEMAEDQSHVPLLPGAAFAIGELSKRFDIILVTARNPAWEKATLKWVKKHFGSTFSSVHFAGKYYDENQQTKGELCKSMGANWLIDDNPEHCQSAVDAGLEAILFGDYGWHYKAGPHLTRCKDWPAVLDYFDKDKP
jgi:FMN phosphatase YigB (HAD superfamily)